MSDPFEHLRLPPEPRAPRPAFVRALRARLLDALELDPADVTIGLPGRSPAMPTTPSTTPATRPAPADPAAVTALQAYLTVHDGVAAIDFYTEAFGAVERFRVAGEDGRLGHAELTIGAVTIMLSDEHPELGVLSPATLGGTSVALYLKVADCDAVYDRVVAAGASTDRPPADQTHGDRTAVIRDPFGHRWMLSQPLEAFDLATYAVREGGGFQVVPGPGGQDADAGHAAPTVGATPTVWPCVNCADAPATIRLLVDTFGFEERLVVADEADPSVIHHAQLRWPEGGGVMVGTAGRQHDEFSEMPTGAASTYLVTERVDDLWRRAVSAGLPVVRELREESYGGRGFSVRDAEGNIWSFGSYAGE